MLLILSSSVVATSFLSGIFGMAGGMVLMGILLALMSVEKAMVIHGVTQFASNGWRAVLWWRSIQWRVLRGYAAGAALVVVLLLALDLSLNRAAVLLMLGATPFIAWLLPPSLQLDVDRRGHSVACGVVCMGVQMLSGVSGPLLDTWFVRSRMTRHEVVSTKAAVQTLSHATRIAFFGMLLATSDQSVGPGLAALLVVSAIVGTSASRLVLDRLTDANFRKITQRLVLTLGAGYLAAGIWQLAQ
jgi:uncharacterized membrane protein YfcA